MLLKMLQESKAQTLSSFLASEFCRVTPAIADEMCKAAKVSPRAKARDIRGAIAEALYQTVQATKIVAPPTNCLSPIGEKAILAGIYNQIKGEFYTAVSRRPSVYRGNPFIIEAGLAFGKAPDRAAQPEKPMRPLAEGEQEEGDSELARVIRYANRVAALSAICLCDLQGGTRYDLTQLWDHPVTRSPVGWADGYFRTHRLRMSPLYE